MNLLYLHIGVYLCQAETECTFLIYVYEEYNNSQDSKFLFMISDFPNNAFETAEFWSV